MQSSFHKYPIKTKLKFCCNGKWIGYFSDKYMAIEQYTAALRFLMIFFNDINYIDQILNHKYLISLLKEYPDNTIIPFEYDNDSDDIIAQSGCILIAMSIDK